MSNKKRFLVTTPDETTWDLKRPLLFLGEWCRLFRRREMIAQLDGELHSYHWDNRTKYYNDYNYLEKIYEQRLSALSIQLGKMHGVSTEIRYWRIIIGPWLRFFIDAVFDRYELIRTVKETDNVDDTWIHNYHLKDWIPIDFQEFYMQFRDDPWNHVIFAECIFASGIPYTIQEDVSIPRKNETIKQGKLRSIAKCIHGFYKILLPSPFNKISIIAAYLPIKKLIKFQRSLGQLPDLYSPNIRILNKQIDANKRLKIVFPSAETSFEKLLNKLIIELIPYAYIENFSALQKKSMANFPANPKIILTANAYQADDGFKVWAAKLTTKQKVPLVIAQHGGHFGIGLLNQTEEHQVQIADVFASWGWISQKHNNVIPLPALKLNTDWTNYDRNGDILLITASYPRYFFCHYSVPIAGQFIDYMQDQVTFINMLDSNLSALLRIRVDSDTFGWEIYDRLKALNVGWAIDRSQTDLATRLLSCRIAVSTYNATVFLETLAANFPTLVFFDPNKYEIRPEVVPIMDNLRKVGIFHDTPKSASDFLNNLGNGLEEWWKGETLQKTRKEFCRTYAYTSTKWDLEWATFLKSIECSS